MLQASNATTLATLAQQIIDAHNAARDDSARMSVQHALAAGNLLIEAKKLVPHGGFLPWVKHNCRLAIRTAQAYMRLADLWPRYPQQIRNDVAYLPLRELVNHFSTPSSRPRTATARSRRVNPQGVQTDCACPCGCGFEWRGDPKPPARTGPLAALIAELQPLRPDQIEAVRAFVRSMAEALDEEAVA